MPDPPRQTAVTKQLRRALQQARDAGADGPRAEAFLDAWFRALGSAYVFVFRKNFDVTNIQVAELEALVRSHSSRETSQSTSMTRGRHAAGTVQFRSVEQYHELVHAAIRVAVAETCSATSSVEVLYGDTFATTALVDTLWGSAVVMLPPGIACDVDAVVAHSGYVHSAGHLVWMSELDRATPSDLYRGLDEHLARHPVQPDCLRPFCAFAHEDFRELDRELAAELRHGLDDLKLWVDKYYLGEVRLAEALATIRDTFSQVTVPGPSRLRALRRGEDNEANVEHSRAIWLIADRRVSERSPVPRRSETRCLVCYDQIVGNENPLHIFDENKPAWRAQTTIPHTLAGAMLNLAKSELPGTPRIADPFAGTGTTLFEAARLPAAKVHGYDIEPVCPLLVDDNLWFFGLSGDELRKVLRRLHELCREIAHPPKRGQSKAARKVIAAFQTDDGVRRTPRLEEPDVVRALDRYEREERLAFYLCMRATVRSAGGLARRERTEADEAWIEAFEEELRSLSAQIERFIAVRNRRLLKRRDTFTLLSGPFSVSATISAEDWRVLRQNVALEIADVREPMADEYDLIIGDPPYGFNTDEDWAELASLYVRWLENSVQALAQPGQIVMCLPERSRTGREAPGFARADFVEHVLDRICWEQGRRIVAPHAVSSISLVGRVGRYYWESERALRRTILHFHIA